jgi:hypothetical protein
MTFKDKYWVEKCSELEEYIKTQERECEVMQWMGHYWEREAKLLVIHNDKLKAQLKLWKGTAP